MAIEIRLVEAERHAELVHPLLTAFGLPLVPERAEEWKRMPELQVRIGAYDGDAVVGCAGAFAFTMSTPGGSVPMSGLTMVGVLPTHRRQGVLTRLMRRHLDEARARAEPVAALWASESPIYGRFGYGFGSHCAAISMDRDHAGFVGRTERAGRARLLGEAEALEIVPALADRIRPAVPGAITRSRPWWQARRFADHDRARAGGGPLQRAVIEIDGRPEAYALYRVQHKWDGFINPSGSVNVLEAAGTTPLATRLVWRYLFDIDLVQRIEADLLPIDHPIFLLAAEPRRLRFSVKDALYVRVVHVETALAARTYGSAEALTFELEDPFCPWNSGRFRLDGGAARAERTDAAAEIRMDAVALGAAYLGGVSFQRLADAGRIEERAPGALERADRLFHAQRAPWCQEIF